MPELRRDPLLDRWVIIASERGNRPTAFDLGSSHPGPVDTAQDPFAEGNERYTTPEVFALRQPGTAPNGPGWRVRVVPNKYPALRTEGGLEPRGFGVYDRLNGIGAHEVVIECPWPDRQLIDLPVSHIAEVLTAYRQRVEDLSRDRRFAALRPRPGLQEPRPGRRGDAAAQPQPDHRHPHSA
jgi:UDPglucose--hexose-1-phosphate uridylyltransferase